MHKKIATKSFLLLWIVFCTFNCMFYMSMIKAAYSSPDMSRPLTNLEDIVETGKPYFLYYDPVDLVFWEKSPVEHIRRVSRVDPLVPLSKLVRYASLMFYH